MKVLLAILISILVIAFLPVGVFIFCLFIIIYSVFAFISWLVGDIPSRPLTKRRFVQ